MLQHNISSLLSQKDLCGVSVSVNVLQLGLQKGGIFPVNFRNIPEILETFQEFLESFQKFTRNAPPPPLTTLITTLITTSVRTARTMNLNK